MKKITIVLCTLLFVVLNSFTGASKKPVKLYPTIVTYIKACESDFSKIPEDRKQQLKKIALFVQTKLRSEKKACLVFICTHNSRRSHTAQLWANAACEYYGVQGVSNYSGGIEITAFNERMVKALVKTGFVITKKTEGTNPNYEVKMSDNGPIVTAFSKKYMDAPNPTSNFGAVMTCSQADKNCPVVFGSKARISLPYDDPKDADGQPNETETYDERTKQIATEILYAFSLVKAKK